MKQTKETVCKLARKRWNSGQTLILTAMAMLALIGFVALAVDVGYLYNVRRQMQTAADAASIAGANALQGSNSASYKQAAQDVATINGFSNGQNGVVVNVGAPASPPNPASGTYVEVDISQRVSTFFLGVIGYKTMNVSAQAVAGTVNNPACIYALDPSAASAISLNGNFTVNASCGIVVDSNSSSALVAKGNGTVSSAGVGISGNYSAGSNVTFTPNPHTNVAPSPDPLASKAAPSVGTYSVLATNQSGKKTLNGTNDNVTLNPGIYTAGIKLSGTSENVTFAAGNYGNGIIVNSSGGTVTFNPGQYQNTGGSTSISISANNTNVIFNAGSYTFVGPVSVSQTNTLTLQPGLYEGGISISGNSNITFSPGTYILAGGGLTVSGGSTLTGSGVTFYNTTGLTPYAGINLAGNETANFSAPTSGPLEGILFFQDRSMPIGSAGSTIVGDSSSTFDGVLYFPTTALTFVGNSSVTGYTTLIADTVSVSGNASITLGDNYSSLADGSPIKSTTLYQ